MTPPLSPLVVSTVLDGLYLGVMLSLAAIGLTLIFGFLGVMNFAHGVFFMLGGYAIWSVTNATGNFWIGLLAAPIAVGIVAGAFELSLLRPTYDLDPIIQLLVTIGFAAIVEASVLIVWGEQTLAMNKPALLSGQVAVPGGTYPGYLLFLIVLGSLLIAATWAFLRFTRTGLIVRASLTDKEMVRAYGARINLLYSLVFIGAIALTAIAGALMTPQRGVGPLTGVSILLDTFIIVVIGGLGSFRGTIVAGLLVGIIDVFAATYISFRLSGLIIFAILIVVLTVRPRGLFGEQGVFTGE